MFLNFLTSYAVNRVNVTIKQLIDVKSYRLVEFTFELITKNERKNK